MSDPCDCPDPVLRGHLVTCPHGKGDMCCCPRGRGVRLAHPRCPVHRQPGVGTWKVIL